MKTKLKIILVSLICTLLLFGLVACEKEPPVDPATKEHTCSRVCSVCGKCLDAECQEEACSDKCQGHQPEPITQGHTCSRVCSVCGKCLDAECEDEACQDKCQGHQPQEPVIEEKGEITGVEVDENGKYYAGMPLSSCVKYRFTLSNGKTSDWYSFVEEDLGSYTVKDGYVTLSTTVYGVGKSFKVSKQIPVSDATITSVTVTRTCNKLCWHREIR